MQPTLSRFVVWAVGVAVMLALVVAVLWPILTGSGS